MPLFTILCPYCRKKIPLSSIRCPECRSVIPHECGEEERKRVLYLLSFGIIVAFITFVMGIIWLIWG